MCECTSIACNMALSGHNAHISLSKSLRMWLGRWATGQNGIVNVNIFMARSSSLLLLCWIQYLHRKWQKRRKKNNNNDDDNNKKSTPKKRKMTSGLAQECGVQLYRMHGWVLLCVHAAAAAAVVVVRSFAIFYLFLWLSCQNMSTDF